MKIDFTLDGKFPSPANRYPQAEIIIPKKIIAQKYFLLKNKVPPAVELQ
jgi:hypothetical protein